MKKRSLKAIVMLVILIVIGIGNMALTSFNDHTLVATVTDKDTVSRHHKKSNKAIYYVFCTDESGSQYKLRNKNTLIRGKFNSFEMYNAIEVGKTYRFTLIGYRIPIISPYENILDFEEIK